MTYKVGKRLGHIFLFKRRAQKGPQLGPRAHFARCINLADTPVRRLKVIQDRNFGKLEDIFYGNIVELEEINKGNPFMSVVKCKGGEKNFFFC